MKTYKVHLGIFIFYW